MRRRSSGLAALPHFLTRLASRQLFGAADRARDAGEWEEAERLYSRLCREFPLAAPLHVQRGNMLKECGRYAEARQAYDLACWLEPDHADVWLQLGHLHKLEGRVAEAAAAYRRSHELDPGRPDPAEELANLEATDDVWAGLTTVPYRQSSLPRSCFSAASGSMLALERLKVSLAYQPR